MAKIFDKQHPFKEQSISVKIRRNTDKNSNCLYKIEHISENKSKTDFFDDQGKVELAITKINSAIAEIIDGIKDDIIEEKTLNKQIKEKLIAEYKDENSL